MTNLEAKQALARKLDIDYANIASNGLFTDTDLQDYIQSAVLQVWDYKLWPFTKKAKKTTSIAADYYDQPTDLMLGSIYRITVGGERFTKIDFDGYQAYKEDDPTGTDKVWAETETYYFINRNAYSVGAEIDLFGKKVAPTLSADADLLPFSPISDNYEYSGNRAIIKLAYAEALASEKKKMPTEAEIERKKAFETLDILWKPFSRQIANAPTRDRSQFNIPNFFGGRNETFRAGNFNL